MNKREREREREKVRRGAGPGGVRRGEEEVRQVRVR